MTRGRLNRYFYPLSLGVSFRLTDMGMSRGRFAGRRRRRRRFRGTAERTDSRGWGRDALRHGAVPHIGDLPVSRGDDSLYRAMGRTWNRLPGTMGREQLRRACENSSFSRATGGSSSRGPFGTLERSVATR
ncbi:hypothetical protein GCM10009039_25660 [Halocalculus aciditolerans]|uniref:Uncharacterized protein n=1 Tax=Halocalculus aciditolerans TaxID=1383812 RepID=A0A830FM90_9EURY|nr:hypothetical protein GCM10009039_25660 [Halocalculus aciditolerans]